MVFSMLQRSNAVHTHPRNRWEADTYGDSQGCTTNDITQYFDTFRCLTEP